MKACNMSSLSSTHFEGIYFIKGYVFNIYYYVNISLCECGDKFHVFNFKIISLFQLKIYKI